MEYNKDNIYMLLVAGGIGTRLWPMSRQNTPKQFHPMLGGESLFARMAHRSADMVGWENVYVVCSADLAEHVLEQSPKLIAEQIIIEPERRDNLPAIALGMSHVLKRDRDACVGVVWSDHYIFDEELFQKAFFEAFDYCEKENSGLVSIGTKPEYPEVGFGYIRPGRKELSSGIYKVRRFLEKPNLKKAKKFVKNGYLWNTGYKVIKAKTFIGDLLDLGLINDQKDIFEKLPAGSIEDLYTPNKKESLVLASNMKWSDVGNWRSLRELELATSKVNSSDQSPICVDSEQVSVMGFEKKVAIVGVSDVIVVNTPDAVLVVHRDQVHQVKHLQPILKAQHPELL